VIIVMKSDVAHSTIQDVVDRVERMGYQTHLSQGEERALIGVIGGDRTLLPENMELLEGVERVLPILLALQAGQSRLPSGGHRHLSERREDRRRHDHHDGRALFRGKP